ncbi:MAG: hypothetical protein JWN14_2501 [Chthonomonadales bacterium]|nr:hypothetical protein [Chthonomonadales bacterium]
MLLARLSKVTFALFALWLCVAARPAQAQIDIVNNLSQPNTGLDPVNGTTWQADAFQIDNNTYTLSSATLRLISTRPNGLITVDIYSNTAGNKPGAPLFSLGTIPLTTTLTDIPVFASSSLTLQPNTVYWVVAHTPGQDNPVGWGATASSAYTGVGTIPVDSAWATSGDSGGTWTTHPLAAGPNQFRIVATTPEPGAIAWMAGLGIAGVSLLRRRRKS